MPQYEIVDSEELRMVKVTLNGDTVRGESGALHYMIGNIEMVTKAPSVGGFLKSMVSGESVFRPTYTGNGEVYFGPPTFGEYHILELITQMRFLISVKNMILKLFQLIKKSFKLDVQ